jgi:TonB family protein
MASGGLVIYEKGKVVFRAEPVHTAAVNERIAEPASPATTPAVTAMPVSSGITGGQLRRRVEPVYSDELKAQGVQGRVVLEVVVSKDGAVENITTLEGDPRLAEAATAAVRQWQYEPYRLNGEAVPMESRVTVTFGLVQP